MPKCCAPIIFVVLGWLVLVQGSAPRILVSFAPQLTIPGSQSRAIVSLIQEDYPSSNITNLTSVSPGDIAAGLLEAYDVFIVPNLDASVPSTFLSADRATLKTWVCEGGIYIATGGLTCTFPVTFGGSSLDWHFMVFGDDIRSTNIGGNGCPPSGSMGLPQTLNGTPYDVITGSLEPPGITPSLITVIEDARVPSHARKLFGNGGYSWGTLFQKNAGFVVHIGGNFVKRSKGSNWEKLLSISVNLTSSPNLLTSSPTPNLPVCPIPTATPSTSPTISSSPTTIHPTAHPTSNPSSLNPTSCPTSGPSTNSPTGHPVSYSPSSWAPTCHPLTEIPTAGPSRNPTTCNPTAGPSTNEPTGHPITSSPSSCAPSCHPVTYVPTFSPTGDPVSCTPTTANPTGCPTSATPSTEPTTSIPTCHPGTSVPTSNPSSCPSSSPTAHPGTAHPGTAHPGTAHPGTIHPGTFAPSAVPTATPTSAPTSNPGTTSPSAIPTETPSSAPTFHPGTMIPSASPTMAPSRTPTCQPSTVSPSEAPSSLPSTNGPTNQPTTTPSFMPTWNPHSVGPTSSPSTAQPTVGWIFAEIQPSNLFVPESGVVRLVAVATRVNGSTFDTSGLSYLWTITRTSSTPEEVVPLTLPDSPAIVINADVLGNGTYAVNVVVSFSVGESRGQQRPSRTAKALLHVATNPKISAVVVSKIAAAPFNEEINASCSATGANTPVVYSFESIETREGTQKLLSGFSTLNTISFTLPEGIFRIRCTIRDSLGGEATLDSQNVVTVQNPRTSSPTPSDTSLPFCAITQDAIKELRDIIRGMNVLSEDIDNLDILVALTKAFSRALNLQLWDLVILTVRYVVVVVEKIPIITQLLSNCEGLGLSTSHFDSINLLSTDSTNADSFAELANLIWDTAENALASALRDAPNEDGSRSRFITQATNDLVKSNAAAPNSSTIATISNGISSVIDQTPPALYVDSQLGNETADVITGLFNLTKTAVDRPEKNSLNLSTCDAVDVVITLLDNGLLRRVGDALVPGETPYEVESSEFVASVSRVFTDQPEFSGSVSTGISAFFSGLDRSGLLENQQRSNGSITFSTILSSFGACRQPPSPADEIEGNITSINVNPLLGPEIIVEIVFPPNVRDTSDCPTVSCQFWNPTERRFSSEGCKLKSDDLNGTVCVCTHLTEFAIIKSQLNCEEVSEVVTYAYVVLSGLYFVLLLIVARATQRLLRANNKYDIIKCACHLVQTTTRIPLCLIISGILEGDFTVRRMPLPALFVLLAVPYCFVWGSYGMTVYQWAMINHHSRINKLVKDMFKRNFWKFQVTMVLLFLVILASWALFLFLLNTPAQFIGPAVMTAVTFCFFVGLTVTGNETLTIMRDIKKRANSKDLTSVTICVKLFGFFLLFQSLAWLTASVFETGRQALVVAMLAYYVADLALVVLQVDLLGGMIFLSMISRFSSRLGRMFSSTKSASGSKKSSSGRGRLTTGGPMSNANSRARGASHVRTRMGSELKRKDSKEAKAIPTDHRRGISRWDGTKDMQGKNPDLQRKGSERRSSVKSHTELLRQDDDSIASRKPSGLEMRNYGQSSSRFQTTRGLGQSLTGFRVQSNSPYLHASAAENDSKMQSEMLLQNNQEAQVSENSKIKALNILKVESGFMSPSSKVPSSMEQQEHEGSNVGLRGTFTRSQGTPSPAITPKSRVSDGNTFKIFNLD